VTQNPEGEKMVTNWGGGESRFARRKTKKNRKPGGKGVRGRSRKFGRGEWEIATEKDRRNRQKTKWSIRQKKILINKTEQRREKEKNKGLSFGCRNGVNAHGKFFRNTNRGTGPDTFEGKPD